MKALFAVLFLMPCALLGQYAGPESMEHDPVGQRYFVSNTGSSSITQQAYDGTVTVFVSGLPASPYGLELMGDTLFACMGGSVRGFSTVNGVEVFNLDIGGTFLNGITTDGTFLYVTDFAAKQILKVNVAQGTYSTLVSNTVSTPNGIVWDPGMDRLWVANWGSNAPIKAYDRNSGQEMGTFSTTLSNIDGITLDCQGRIIVASWSPDQLTRFTNDFSGTPEVLIAPGLNNAADLDYDAVNDLVCVPNSGSNTVALVAVDDCTTGLNEAGGYGSFAIYPNPSNGLLNTDLRMGEAVPFLIFDGRGCLVASGTMRPNGVLDISALAPGVYVLDIPKLRKRARFMRR